jgi:hypothetical protein
MNFGQDLKRTKRTQTTDRRFDYSRLPRSAGLVRAMRKDCQKIPPRKRCPGKCFFENDFRWVSLKVPLHGNTRWASWICRN